MPKNKHKHLYSSSPAKLSVHFIDQSYSHLIYLAGMFVKYFDEGT